MQDLYTKVVMVRSARIQPGPGLSLTVDKDTVVHSLQTYWTWAVKTRHHVRPGYLQGDGLEN